MWTNDVGWFAARLFKAAHIFETSWKHRTKSRKKNWQKRTAWKPLDTELDWCDTKVPPPIFRDIFSFFEYSCRAAASASYKKIVWQRERHDRMARDVDARSGVLRFGSSKKNPIHPLHFDVLLRLRGRAVRARPGPEGSRGTCAPLYDPRSKELFRGVFVPALQDGTRCCLNVGQNECLCRFMHIPLWLSSRASMIASRITFWEKEIRKRKDRLLNFQNAKPSRCKKEIGFTRATLTRILAGASHRIFFASLFVEKRFERNPFGDVRHLHGRDQSAMKDAKLVKRFRWTTRFRGRGPHKKMKEVFSSNERPTTRSASPGHGFV